MKYLGVIAIFFLLLSCDNNPVETEIKRSLGTTLIINEINKERYAPLFMKNGFLIINYLKTEECKPCELDKLRMLKHYSDDLKKYDTGVVIMIDDKNDESSNKVKEITEDLAIDYPIVIDNQNNLTANNKIFSSTIGKFIIIDKNFTILWIGFPLHNDLTYNNYIKFMNKTTQNKD